MRPHFLCPIDIHLLQAAGTVHINVDAALFSPSCRMEICIVIRNHKGECSVACSELVQEVTAAEVAEVLALRRAVSLA